MLKEKCPKLTQELILEIIMIYDEFIETDFNDSSSDDES